MKLWIKNKMINFLYTKMKKIKILTLVAFTSVTLTACNTQTYYEKHNMLNNKQPCPAGTQAD